MRERPKHFPANSHKSLPTCRVMYTRTSFIVSSPTEARYEVNILHVGERKFVTVRLIFGLIFVPLLYHSMGQIIKSVFVCLCMYVCMYVCVCGHAYGRIFQPIFTKFGKNLWGLNRKNWLGWGRNPKMPSPILAPKTKILGAWIGILSQICKKIQIIIISSKLLYTGLA